MKKNLLSALLIMASTFFYAQTITWTGNTDEFYSKATNWSPEQVPTATNDIVIPTGKTMSVNVEANVKSIKVNGNAKITLNNNLSFTGASTVGENAGIIWNAGNFYGAGTLTNNGIITLSGNDNKLISNSTIVNKGTFTISSSGILYLSAGSTIENAASGTINLNVDGSLQFSSGQGTIKNAGVIKKSQSSGLYSLDVPLQNNNGKIIVEKGTLRLNNSLNTFTNGIYNVTEGNVLEWANDFTCKGTLDGKLDGSLNWTGRLLVAPDTQAVLDFDDAKGLNWLSGSFSGDGTLKNTGVINLESNNSRSIGGASVLLNDGLININSTGIQYIGYGSPTLKNNSSGIINILAASGSIQFASGQGMLINTGLIKKSSNTGTYGIIIPLKNNNGTILVEKGILQLSNDLNVFTDGIYNVTSGNILEWASTFTCIGILRGEIKGSLNWNGTLNVNAGSQATLDFDNTKGINWVSGSFSGNGTLVNSGILNLETNSSRSITGSSILKNDGILNINSSGVQYLGYGSPTLNNSSSGIININAVDGSLQFASGQGKITNAGIIKRDQGTGNYGLLIPMNNVVNGNIIANTGVLSFSDFTGKGILAGNGTVQLPTETLFEGVISPGKSPGKLTFMNSLATSAEAVLNVELNGKDQGIDYDLIALQGNAVMNGKVKISLGFNAQAEDEFIVVTTTGSINECNLTNTASATYNGYNYKFDVLCRGSNQVVLKVKTRTLGVPQNELSAITVYPNPSQGYFSVDLGRVYDYVSVKVFDLFGKQVLKRAYSNLEKINQEITAPAGVYFIKLNRNEGTSKTIKLIKR